MLFLSVAATLAAVVLVVRLGPTCDCRAIGEVKPVAFERAVAALAGPPLRAGDVYPFLVFAAPPATC